MSDRTHIVSTALKRIESNRLNLRVDRQTKKSLAAAAAASGRTLTDFILASATATANDVLAARTTFVLSPKDWQKFNALLDSPPRELPRLKRLFREKSVLEK